LFADVFTDKDYKEVVTLVVRKKDGTILIYGEGEEPTIILPPIPASESLDVSALHSEAKMLGGQVKFNVEEKVEVLNSHDG